MRPLIRSRLLAGLVVVAGFAFIGAETARAAVHFFSTRSAFDAAAPGIPLDRFPSPFVFRPYPDNSVFHTRPLTFATNDSVVPAGCVLPGLTITTEAPVFESQAIKFESAGAGTLSIGAATFQDVLVLDFSPPVAAVGADVFGHVYPGPVFPGNVEVTVYSGATQIGYTNPSLPGTGPGFVGVTSDAANITRVTYLFNPTADVDADVFVRNVAFGTPGPACCPADFNCSGSVSVQDIFDFLGAYFAGASLADFNHSGAVSVQDIFDFLAAYFAGCP